MTKKSATTPNVNKELFEKLLASKRELSNNELAELVRKIRPVVRDKNGRCYYIKPVDPREVAFTWDPVLTEEATRITRIETIHTLHSFGYYGMFKPSIAEVLSMVPQNLLDKVIAFETIGPSDMSDLKRQWAAVNANYHVAVTAPLRLTPWWYGGQGRLPACRTNLAN